MKSQFSIFLFFLLATSLSWAQTPYPLSFHWKGKIDNGPSFELLVAMIDGDQVISGKGSRLKGYCSFLDSGERYPIDGTNKNGEMLINCYTADKQLRYSFAFSKMDGRQNRQTGLFTNGKQKQTVSLETPSLRDMPTAQAFGFCLGVNERVARLRADSTAMLQLKNISALPFQKIGEGYRLDSRSFLAADYYGMDYLEYSDSSLLADSSTAIRQLSWQLLPSEEKRPFLLEVRSLKENGQIKTLALGVWQYQADHWACVDSLVIPSAYYQDGQFQPPSNLIDFYVCSDALVFTIAQQKKPLILYWRAQKFRKEP